MPVDENCLMQQLKNIELSADSIKEAIASIPEDYKDNWNEMVGFLLNIDRGIDRNNELMEQVLKALDNNNKLLEQIRDSVAGK